VDDERYFASPEGIENLTEQDKADIEAVVKWCEKGAEEKAYWDPRLKEEDKNKRPFTKFSTITVASIAMRRCDNERTKRFAVDSFVGISKVYGRKTQMDKGRLLSDQPRPSARHGHDVPSRRAGGRQHALAESGSLPLIVGGCPRTALYLAGGP